MKSEVDFFQHPLGAYALPGSDIVCVEYPRDPAPAVVKVDVRGGIRWPQVISDGTARNLVGAAVLLVSEVGHPEKAVVREFEFHCVDDVLDDGQILYSGIGRFFNWAWSTYYCRTFYLHEHLETHRRFQRQVASSFMIKPSPTLWRLDWHDDAVAEIAIMEAVNRGTLSYKRDGLVYKALQAAQLSDKAFKISDVPPVLGALAAAIIGMERYKRKESEGPFETVPEREEFAYAGQTR